MPPLIMGVSLLVALSLVRRAAEGLGAKGLLLDDATAALSVLPEARQLARSGRPVDVNARIGRSDFRKGSLSM